MFDSDKLNASLIALAIVGLTALGFRGCAQLEANTRDRLACEQEAFGVCSAQNGDCGVQAALGCGEQVGTR